MPDNLPGPDTTPAAEDLAPETTDAAPVVDATPEPATLDYSEADSAAVDADAIEGGGQPDAADDGDQEPSQIFYDIEGEEIPLETIQQWKSGHMMQSDYTKKTQELKTQRDEFAAQRQALDDKLTMLKDIETELETVVLGDLSGVNMDELMQSDPSEYLRIQKLLGDKKETLSNLAKKRAQAQDALNAENYKSLHTNMGWEDDSKRKQDLELITGFAKRQQVSEKDFSGFLHPAIMQAFAIAEKHMKLQETKPEITKRVVKTPKGPKPSATVSTTPKSLAERLYGT